MMTILVFVAALAVAWYVLIVRPQRAISGAHADSRTTALVQLATALDGAGSGAVVAGDLASAGDGGLVAAVRADQDATSAVSTVDNVTAAAGRISAVLALAAEGRGTSGEYGVGEDTKPVPPPAS